MSCLLALAAVFVGLLSFWRIVRSLVRRPPPITGPQEEALRLLERQYLHGTIGPREFAERRRALTRR